MRNSVRTKVRNYENFLPTLQSPLRPLSALASFMPLAHISNITILIRSDNQGVIGAFKSGRGRNYQVNQAIRRVEVIGHSTNVLYVLTYVESALNKADPISRGELGSPETQFPHRIHLPPELVPYLLHV